MCGRVKILAQNNKVQPDQTFWLLISLLVDLYSFQWSYSYNQLKENKEQPTPTKKLLLSALCLFKYVFRYLLCKENNLYITQRLNFDQAY